MVRKSVLMLLFALVVLAVSVSAQNATNNTNSTPVNYSVTHCNELCLNSSVQWSNLFVCDVNGTLFACCNNMTLCEDLYGNCSPVTYLNPQFNLPWDGGDGGDGGDTGGDEGGDGGAQPATTSSDYKAAYVGSNKRSFRLFISGDFANEPLKIHANNIFGAMDNIDYKIYRDDTLVKKFNADGVATIMLEEPGRYTVYATRAGYLTQESTFFLYEREDAETQTIVEDIPEPVEEKVVVPAPEPAEYERISGMATLSKPKEKLNSARLVLLVLGAVALLGFAGRKFLFRPKKPKEEGKIDWGF